MLPSLSAGPIEMTIPDKTNSNKQQYRLNALRKTFIASHAHIGS
ncbi:MAG: Fic family protein [Pirellula sp.]